jgi:hypothetical protein
MALVQVSSGFGQLLPHQVFQLDSEGQPTASKLSLRAMSDLMENVRPNNPVLAVPSYPTTAILPGGSVGNHFMMIEFTQDVDVATILSASGAQTSNNNLAGTVIFEQVDPSTGTTTVIRGRVFIDGYTYAGIPTGSPPELQFQQWILPDGTPRTFDSDGDGLDDTPGMGYPGTETGFAGSNLLTNPRTIVFIPDQDGSLLSHETFPADVGFHARVTTGVKNTQGRNLAETALAAGTLGLDVISPGVMISLPPESSPEIVPGGGQSDVDPLTTIQVNFSEPLQPLSVGDLPDGSAPSLSSSLNLKFGPATQRVEVPFTALPVSIYDLSRYTLTPAYNFPGDGPEGENCGTFSKVDITVVALQLNDLRSNINSLGATTFFTTGEGPGITNAPVAPDTIYVTRGGAEPAISVIDLNGFGQSTGSPIYDETHQVSQAQDSNFPDNSNFKLQGTLIRPPLVAGTCTVDGGSSGVFSLTRDSSLNDRLVRTPVMLTPGDMMLGRALDSTFNNSPAPFGCQASGGAGGGNLCATDGRKFFQVGSGAVNTLLPTSPPPPVPVVPIQTTAGAPNTISFAPHPNPPALSFPPPCISPFIGGQEPTSIFTALPLPPAAPPNGLGFQNLLVPGAAVLGDPLGGLPPNNLLSSEQNAHFIGPHAPQSNESACLNYGIRQQIGQFLYSLDRARNELVIFNSNSMRVIERLELPDPTSLAMSPNLAFLAVTNQSVDLVSFIDINPISSTFHELIKTTVVGNSPRGIAWEPGNEDVLVCNEGSSTVSIISAFSLEVRKELSSQLNQPFELAVTGRQATYGYNRNVYFAYIMNRTGKVALFESGPNGVNGWGFDDIVGTSPINFQNPKAIHPDYKFMSSGVWIVHEGKIDPETGIEGPVGTPAVSNLLIESANAGQIALTSASLPGLRDLTLGVPISVGGDILSGVPVDIAFDNQKNFGGLVTHLTSFSAGVALANNGKSLVRPAGGGVNNSCEPNYMFIAVPSPTFGSEGLVDVVDISGSGFSRVDTSAYEEGIQSIPCTNAAGLMDYWRQ